MLVTGSLARLHVGQVPDQIEQCQRQHYGDCVPNVWFTEPYCYGVQGQRRGGEVGGKTRPAVPRGHVQC